jgi:hypothetical protein
VYRGTVEIKLNMRATSMKLRPVKQYRQPDYPTQDYLREHPELLRFVPTRWQQNRVVLTALAATACLIFSSKTFAASEAGSAKAKSMVAPIFVHGEGRGGFGCVSVSPPIYFSEAEAFQVIQDEAAKAGIQFTLDSPDVADVDVPFSEKLKWSPPQRYRHDLRNSPYHLHEDSLLYPEAYKTSKYRLIILDGYFGEKHIGFEFVSKQDYKDWIPHVSYPSGPVFECTADTEDYLNAATGFRDAIEHTLTSDQKEKEIILGVFYEPAESSLSISFRKQKGKTSEVNVNSAVRQPIKYYNEEYLRLQVRDFIQWLKSEGII